MTKPARISPKEISGASGGFLIADLPVSLCLAGTPRMFLDLSPATRDCVLDLVHGKHTHHTHVPRMSRRRLGRLVGEGVQKILSLPHQSACVPRHESDRWILLVVANSADPRHILRESLATLSAV